MSTQEEWLLQQMEAFQGSGSGTPGEMLQRQQIAEDFDAFQAGLVEPQSLLPLSQMVEDPVLTDFNSFMPTNGNGGGLDALFRGIGQVIGAIGAPTVGGAISGMMQGPILGPIVRVDPQGVPQQMPPPMQIAANVGGLCWSESLTNACGQPLTTQGLRRRLLRRRVKWVRLPNGNLAMMQTCAPRRMNPLNPRALARAGRRVASFSRIAKGMQQMLERSCRVGARRKTSRSYMGGRSCSTKRCR